MLNNSIQYKIILFYSEMGNNIRFYDFYDSWGLIGSTVTFQIRVENVVKKYCSNFTAPEGIIADNCAR